MFGKNKDENEGAKVEKLSGPKLITGALEKKLTTEFKMDPELVKVLMVLARKRPQTEKAFDCRIFDPSEAEGKGLKIKDYTSLDTNPELTLYEGWFDDSAKQAEVKEKRKLVTETNLFSLAEIQEKIEALKEPGSSVFFYQARGPAYGGPLGRGAAVIEKNAEGGDKKSKIYTVYTANVAGIEPSATNRQKLMESDKAKDIAKWVKDAHHKRMY